MSSNSTATFSSSSSTTDDYSDESPSTSSGNSSRLTASAVVFVVVLAFLLFAFHLVSKWMHAYLYGSGSARRRRRTTLPITVNLYDDDLTSAPRGGLDKSEIALLPSFSVKSGADPGVECAVCLSDFEDGEHGRLLPACKHSFHVDCIDMWLFTHSTCPLCRTPVIIADICASQETFDHATAAVASGGDGSSSPDHRITIETDQPESSSASVNSAPISAKPPRNPERRPARQMSIQIPSRPDPAELILQSPSPGACFSLQHSRLSRRASPSPGAGRVASPASARLALKRILSCGAQSSFSKSASLNRPSDL